ncbi:Histone deacetylase hda1 [Paramarasmius palmivorus]|uniref:histone deacetylase n=1 Tax=Paramarasmius palmivorus TaxID=297713 RepID=A0AAW0DNT0_9AGAR
MANAGLGVPVKLLHESLGHVITVELKTGQLYRGKLAEAEDNLNISLKDITVTGRDGRVSQLDQVYIRGSMIRFFIVPDMLQNAPMFKRVGPNAMRGRGIGTARGRATIMRANARRGRGVAPSVGRVMDMDVDPAPGPSNVDNEAGPSNAGPPNTTEVERKSPHDVQESNLRVGYVYSVEMTIHFKASGHYEDPRRITRIWELLNKGEYHTKMKRLPIRPVTREEILLVHSEDHWDKVLAIEHMTPQQVADSEEYYETLSLYVMQGTTRAACLSCGGTIEACLPVARGELQKSFAIVRPPGHHAEPDEHMGFCFFNNVAVAARVIQQTTNVKKILILDWDVHHGNGTQKAFNDDPSILYISLHRYEGGTFYPSGPFGALYSCGEGPGLGYSVNIPWPKAGMGDADYLHAFHKIVMPIAMEFGPDMVIISAGFDAAIGDELGQCEVSPAGYGHMTHMLSSLAGGRLAVVLEGGYNIESSAKSAIAVLKVVLGEAPQELPPLTVSEEGTETVWLVAKEQSKYWTSVDPKACEPREDVEPIAFSIPEILKAHRQHYLYSEHAMMQVPLLGELDQKFSTQIMCTSDLFENNTMIVFVHEFGNLRTELDSKTRCDVNLEKSYLIDFSKELITWVKKEGYSLLDVNVFPKPIAAPAKRSKSAPDVVTQMFTYLWDNYIQLSNAKHVILIGHGPGCTPIMGLLEKRLSGIQKIVKGVVQVVGHTKVPIIPKYEDELRQWYTTHSFVALPHNHIVLGPETKPKELRRYGTLCPIDESVPIKLIMRALPGIQEFIKRVLDQKRS